MRQKKFASKFLGLICQKSSIFEHAQKSKGFLTFYGGKK